MWFLLLLAIDNNFSAHTVHPTLALCEQAKQTAQDTCVTVSLNIIQLPPTNPISVTELAPIEPPQLELPPVKP